MNEPKLLIEQKRQVIIQHYVVVLLLSISAIAMYLPISDCCKKIYIKTLGRGSESTHMDVPFSSHRKISTRCLKVPRGYSRYITQGINRRIASQYKAHP